MKSTKFSFSLITAAGISLICTMAFAENPSFVQAVSDYNSGKYIDAIKKFSSLARLNPKNATIYYYAAMCYQNLGKPNDARALYLTSMEKGDVTLKAYAQRAIANLNKKNTEVMPASGQMGSLLAAVTPDVAGMKVVAPVCHLTQK